MDVKLLNPEAVKNALTNIGKFASICMGDIRADQDKNYRAIGKQCIHSGHMSPARSIQWTFSITGISRVCSHQLVRHHVGIAVNQLSNVYTKASNSDIIYPESVAAYLEKHGVDKLLVQDSLEDIYEVYQRMIVNGVSNSDARYILPNGMVTAINMSLTPEALIHLAHERLCSRAQWEIREVVKRMCDLVIAEDDFWSCLLVPKCLYLHGCPEKYGCGYYNAVQNKVHIPTLEPVEDRIQVLTCTKCGTKVLRKDDDLDTGETAENFVCAMCRKVGGKTV